MTSKEGYAAVANSEDEFSTSALEYVQINSLHILLGNASDYK